jgi:hypothetical protein
LTNDLISTKRYKNKGGETLDEENLCIGSSTASRRIIFLCWLREARGKETSSGEGSGGSTWGTWGTWSTWSTCASTGEGSAWSTWGTWSTWGAWSTGARKEVDILRIRINQKGLS